MLPSSFRIPGLYLYYKFVEKREREINESNK